jgi:hypothetical protein
MTDLRLYLFAEKESMPCAMILGINIFIPLPRSAIIIKMVTIPEYGFSKLKIPGLDVFLFAAGAIDLSISICNVLQRNSIKPVIQLKNR